MTSITSRKKMIMATAIIAIAAAIVALVAYPACTANAGADYAYALNEENWALTEENNETADQQVAGIRIVTINANGFAFQRIDEETLKQFKAETQLTITVRPEGENVSRVSVTGTVKVNGEVYTIENGTAVLRTKRHILFICCEGADKEGNKISLKFGAVYFWWGRKAYALRSKASLQISEKPMLLLQRGIARIQ